LVVTLTHDNTLSRGTDSATCHTQDLTSGNFFWKKKQKKT